MNRIIEKKLLARNIYLIKVEAPRIAASALPGQFLVVINDPKGERIPLTISDYDKQAGTVDMVIQQIGVSTRLLCSRNVGECYSSVLGPLGVPSDFVKMSDEELKGRRYLFVAGGVGTAPVYPQAKYLHERGAMVDVIIGAKTKDLLIFEEAMSKVCTNLYVCTDDGSYGFGGLVTKKIEDLLANGKTYDQAVAIGPMIMMKFVTKTLQPSGIPLTVSLNTLMVDATGMCGACRVTVGGKTRFACVEGPEFDAYQVDFDEAMRRQGMYNAEKVTSHTHKCKIGRE
ncbi:MAG: sulfide/dihydroorotate dehydrogenase-like FAD/NAD-binding protein [Bacteroidales bacterium]|nr:sulfide/dihydroorotate dehydrogenase-like FAD/NAD-binding protein [Bacteroidales bacterium]